MQTRDLTEAAEAAPTTLPDEGEIHAYGDMVIVRPLTTAETTQHGLFIAQGTNKLSDAARMGYVVSVGDGRFVPELWAVLAAKALESGRPLPARADACVPPLIKVGDMIGYVQASELRPGGTAGPTFFQVPTPAIGCILTGWRWKDKPEVAGPGGGEDEELETTGVAADPEPEPPREIKLGDTVEVLVGALRGQIGKVTLTRGQAFAVEIDGRSHTINRKLLAHPTPRPGPTVQTAPATPDGELVGKAKGDTPNGGPVAGEPNAGSVDEWRFKKGDHVTVDQGEHEGDLGDIVSVEDDCAKVSLAGGGLQMIQLKHLSARGREK